MGMLSQLVFTVIQLVGWVRANAVPIVALVGLIVGAASTIIKTLEKVSDAIDKLVENLCQTFPGLKGIDGRLKHIVAVLDMASGWLDALAKNGLLNWLAMTPKHAYQGPPAPAGSSPALKAFLIVAMSAALFAPAPARAQVTYQIGPTFPLVLIDIGPTHTPYQVLSGAGVQISFTDAALQKTFLGQTWDMLDVAAMAFGSKVSSNSGPSFGELSGGLGVCTLSSLLCVVGGKHILDFSGAILPGDNGWYVGAHASFNIGWSPPKSAGETIALPRANTVYLKRGE